MRTLQNGSKVDVHNGRDLTFTKTASALASSMHRGDMKMLAEVDAEVMQGQLGCNGLSTAHTCSLAGPGTS